MPGEKKGKAFALAGVVLANLIMVVCIFAFGLDMYSVLLLYLAEGGMLIAFDHVVRQLIPAVRKGKHGWACLLLVSLVGCELTVLFFAIVLTGVMDGTIENQVHGGIGGFGRYLDIVLSTLWGLRLPLAALAVSSIVFVLQNPLQSDEVEDDIVGDVASGRLLTVFVFMFAMAILGPVMGVVFFFTDAVFGVKQPALFVPVLAVLIKTLMDIEIQVNGFSNILNLGKK